MDNTIAASSASGIKKTLLYFEPDFPPCVLEVTLFGDGVPYVDARSINNDGVYEPASLMTDSVVDWTLTGAQNVDEETYSFNVVLDGHNRDDMLNFIMAGRVHATYIGDAIREYEKSIRV